MDEGCNVTEAVFKHYANEEKILWSVFELLLSIYYGFIIIFIRKDLKFFFKKTLLLFKIPVDTKLYSQQYS